jgi:hypothetical protein
VPYNNIAASANSILLTGNQSFTGLKKSSTVTGVIQMQCHLLMNQILRVHKLLILTYQTQVQ